MIKKAIALGIFVSSSCYSSDNYFHAEPSLRTNYALAIAIVAVNRSSEEAYNAMYRAASYHVGGRL